MTTTPSLVSRPVPARVPWALEARDTERIDALGEILAAMDDYPPSLSSADRADLRRWATRAYIGSRRSGRFAMADAVARLRAQQAIQLELADTYQIDSLRDTQKHHANMLTLAAINAYHQSLEGFKGPIVPPDVSPLQAEVDPSVWWHVSDYDRTGMLIAFPFFICPACWPMHQVGGSRTADGRTVVKTVAGDRVEGRCHWCSKDREGVVREVEI